MVCSLPGREKKGGKKRGGAREKERAGKRAREQETPQIVDLLNLHSNQPGIHEMQREAEHTDRQTHTHTHAHTHTYTHTYMYIINWET
jgi:hypothetical protein